MWLGTKSSSCPMPCRQLGHQCLEFRLSPSSGLSVESIDVEPWFEPSAPWSAATYTDGSRRSHRRYRTIAARIIEPEVLVELQPVGRPRHDRRRHGYFRKAASGAPSSLRAIPSDQRDVRKLLQAAREPAAPVGMLEGARQVRLLLLAQRVLQLHHDQLRPRGGGEAAVHRESQLPRTAPSAAPAPDPPQLGSRRRGLRRAAAGCGRALARPRASRRAASVGKRPSNSRHATSREVQKPRSVGRSWVDTEAKAGRG